MSSTLFNSRSTFPANTGLGIRLTPNNSPFRPPRSPTKKCIFNDSALSLTRIIGTTVNSPTGFDSLSSSRIFAYVAGAAVVVVHIDHDLKCSQRFFRARPTAVPAIATNNNPGTPSTPVNTANDSRNRSVAGLRDAANFFSVATPNNSRSDWIESPSSRTWTSRERIKAATCLSLSRDGRFLAVGETGYNPRALIFGLNESSDNLLVSLNEHRFGLRAVSFSPNQRFLATLGTEHDGYLYIWAIANNGAARLHSSNKCTSFAKGLAWMSDNSLIVVGTRFVKVWRVESGSSTSPPTKAKPTFDSPTPAIQIPLTVTRTLAGRNCLLGPLADTTFTCVAPISESMAIVCSERGDICLLDDIDGQKFAKVARTGFGIATLAVDVLRRLIVVGGRDGLTKTFPFDDLLSACTAEPFEDDAIPQTNETSGGQLCALAFVDDLSIAIDSQRAITISKNESPLQIGNPPSTVPPAPLPAHRDGAVLGIRLLDQPNAMENTVFFTWSSGGEIIFWDMDGQNKARLVIEIEQLPGEDDSYRNQCQVVRASKEARFLVIGDRQGSLQIFDPSTRTYKFSTRAHTSEIQDIAIYEGTTNLVASCSRDRTVQLFRQRDNDEWALTQTMDEHTANICNVAFSDDGETLISASSDRTIQIRQLVSRVTQGQEVTVAIPIKVITVKASPVSMTISSRNQVSHLTLSMMDRTVTTYEMFSGKLVSSFRTSDSEGNDAVVMDALAVGKPPAVLGRPTILAGVSGTDKSVRIYDANTGVLLGREWGHTTAVTDVALLETNERTALISTASDGTIMMWDMSSRATDFFEPDYGSNGDREQSPPKENISARPPLRKVLSKAELADFQRPSPAGTPTSRNSPPRLIRRKTSRYSVASPSPRVAIPPVPTMPASYAVGDDGNALRDQPRMRSRSPPVSPKGRVSRRRSLADIRGRSKSSGIGSEFGSLNMATEQTCRTLRAYRKKLSSSETVKPELLKELDQELRLTAKTLGEKTLKTKAMNETVLTELLDQYSERLVSIFDEKLRLGLLQGIAAADSARPVSKIEPNSGSPQLSDGPY